VEESYAVLMKNITKKFSSTVANYRVDFDLRKGEIHALLGENGAGKTTLMRILYGEIQPDEGEIFVWGKKTVVKSPSHALRLGISMVHQHFRLVDSLTVAEHLALCSSEVRFLSKRKIENLVAEYFKEYYLKVDLDAHIWQLSAGEKQKVEILKALIRGARILVLDEPTSSLTPLEVKDLFRVLHKLRNRGYAIVFISHKLGEVLEISDRITILRKGKKVATIPASEADPVTLAKLMVGDLPSPAKNTHTSPPGGEVLQVKSLYVKNDRGGIAVRGVSFSVRKGEIFGVIGVAGNGQRELAEAIAGLRRPVKGEIFFRGILVNGSGPRELARRGLAYIPEESFKTAVLPELTVAENSILRYYWRFTEKGFIKETLVEKWAKSLIKEFDILAEGLHVKAKSLSGGNLQKLVIARELSSKPELLVAVNPTAGLDISASQRTREKLLEIKAQGSGVLLFTEDIDEALQICDRIAVIFKGSFKGLFSREEADVNKISLLMAGVDL